MTSSSTIGLRQIPTLLRGETTVISEWLHSVSIRQVFLFLTVTIGGAGLYGAAIGFWRDPLQAFYTGLKLPLVIILTAVGNGLFNGMVAPLLGLSVGFRQSFLAVLMSFTIASAILGAFSPLAFFLVWNTPPVTDRWGAEAFSHHSIILLVNVLAIGFAGVAANIRLFQLLQKLGGSRMIALKILLVWLGGNLFLGSQLSWILRPFVGSPGLPIEFLRHDAFNGNFYEAVFRALKNLLFS